MNDRVCFLYGGGFGRKGIPCPSSEELENYDMRTGMIGIGCDGRTDKRLRVLPSAKLVET